MKVEARKFYTYLFVLVLLLQLYLPSFKANIAIQVFALLIYAYFDNIVLSRAFFRQMLPLFFLLLFPLVVTLFYKHEIYDVIRDIVHFLKPVTGILIGYIFFRKINDFKYFVQVIVAAGVVSALIHLFIIGFFVDFGTGSIEKIRHFTRDNFLELFSVFFYLYYKRFYSEPLFEKKRILYPAIAILLFSNILYFSRTMIVMAIILIFSMYGYTKLTGKALRVFAAAVIAIALFYSYLHSTTIRRGQPGLEGFLYKVKIAPSEIFETQIDRDDHRDLWDHWRGYEAKRAFALMELHPESYIFGMGHGSLVNLQFYAPLSDDPKGMKYISELHNGYMYILYKTGIIGMLVYVFILVQWYIVIYSRLSFTSALLSAIGLNYIISTLTITGLYNSRDIIIFLIGALIYYGEKKTPATKTSSQ